MARRSRKKTYSLLNDFLFITLGIFIALILVKSGVLDSFLSLLRDYHILASFVAGIFFTSAFTLAPASIALMRIVENAPLPSVALWGGLGAMCGDLVLFFFIRDRFADDLMSVIKPSLLRRFMHTLHFGFLKWISPIVGALIIASPLPDEFGLTLMGMSKTKTAVLMPIAFAMNVLGIYALVALASFVS
jgi:hypothetical protein